MPLELLRRRERCSGKLLVGQGGMCMPDVYGRARVCRLGGARRRRVCACCVSNKYAPLGSSVCRAWNQSTCGSALCCEFATRVLRRGGRRVWCVACMCRMCLSRCNEHCCRVACASATSEGDIGDTRLSMVIKRTRKTPQPTPSRLAPKACGQGVLHTWLSVHATMRDKKFFRSFIL